TSAAQFEFAAEFVSFLVAAAGLALVLTRGDLLARATWARSLLALGFLAMGTAAFLHGSLVVDESARTWIGVLRAGGLVAVAVGSISWAGRPWSRFLLWAGLVATAVGIGFGVQGTTTSRTAAN